jgi:RNA polymerase sigma-70 factor (ECF subfamily)
MSSPIHEFFSRCFHQVDAELRGLLSYRLGPQEAGDVAQEAYVHLLQYPNPDSIENPRAFLFKTASNLVVDRHRQNRRRANHIDGEVDVEKLSSCTPDAETAADSALQFGRFLAALEELPELYRYAFILNRFEGLTHPEIAGRLGLSQKTVQRYILKALDHCAKRLA